MSDAPTRSQTFIDQENAYGARNYHPLDVVATRGEGKAGHRESKSSEKMHRLHEFPFR